MIKFFRRIRYDLINQSKTTKYFKYAIGEITLVVIGILIALQVNNLNEQRKERAVRNSYYEGMINSFDKDLQEIEAFSKFIERSQNNLNDFKTNVKNASSYKEASQYFKDINIFTADCDLNSSIWQSIVSSGNIGLISEDIKSSLLDFWRSYSDYYEADYANKQHYWDLIKSSVMSSESKISTYSLELFKDNPELFEDAENSRDYMKEVHSVLFAVAFRERGNLMSKNNMLYFKNEIEKIKSEMIKELNK